MAKPYFEEGNSPGDPGLGKTFNSFLNQRLDAALYGNTFQTPDGDRVDPATVTVQDAGTDDEQIEVKYVTGYLPVSDEVLEDRDDLWHPKSGCLTHWQARMQVAGVAESVRYDIGYQEDKVSRAKKKLKKLRKRLAKAEQSLVDFDEQFPMEE